MRLRTLQFCILVSAFLSASPALAQQDGGQPTSEEIEIGLSRDVVEIEADFAGADLTIFGSVDNVDPLVQRQGRYDIFLILQGPSSRVATRRKDRVLGIWMNTEQREFGAVPESYLIATTRLPRDITDLNIIARLALGVEQIRIRATENEPRREDVQEFASALRRLKAGNGLYREFHGGVQFISQSLFRADMRLPSNVPLGMHRVQAYLFKSGELIAQTQSALEIRKGGLEYLLYGLAKNQPVYYGLAAVLIALLVGWLGRVLFKKD